MTGFRKSVLSGAMLRRLVKECLAVVGAVAIAVTIAAGAFPQEVAEHWPFVIGATGVALLVAIVRAWPKRTFTISFAHPATTMTVKVGDLFEEKGHLIVGFSDTFDTEIGKLISPASIQGQFLTRIYQGDRTRLDEALEHALPGHEAAIVVKKAAGKTWKYPLGTTATLAGEGRKYFCCGYSSLDSATYKAESDVDTIWNALSHVWDAIRIHGELRPVAMPVIGSSLARVTGGTCATLIRLILLSYFVHSRSQPISREFTLVISDKDLHGVNLVEIEDFARTLNC